MFFRSEKNEFHDAKEIKIVLSYSMSRKENLFP